MEKEEGTIWQALWITLGAAEPRGQKDLFHYNKKQYNIL